jgi:hypothetical protein
LAHRIDLTLDCADGPALAEFWKLALGYIDEPPPAPFESRRDWLRSLGVPDDQPINAAWLCDPTGVGPRLSLLPVPEGKTAKNRLHMDVRVSGEGIEDEIWSRIMELVDELVAVGGSVLQAFPKHHVVMADPEGNEFCVAFQPA